MSDKITTSFMDYFAMWLYEKERIRKTSREMIQIICEFLDANSDRFKVADNSASSVLRPSTPSPEPTRQRAPKRRSESGSSDEDDKKRSRRDDTRTLESSSSSDDSDDNRPAAAAAAVHDSDVEPDSDDQQQQQPQQQQQQQQPQQQQQQQQQPQQQQQSSTVSSVQVSSERMETRSMARQRLLREARSAAQTTGRAAAQATVRGQSGTGSAAGSGTGSAAGSGAGSVAGSGASASGSGVSQPAPVNQPAPPVGPTCYHCGVQLITDGTQPQRPALCVLCGRYRPRGQTGVNRQPLAIDWSGRLLSERPQQTILGYVERQTREHGGVLPQRIYTGT